MSDQAETDGSATQVKDSASSWVAGMGWALISIGLLGAVLLWSDMSNSTLDYSSVEKWRAILSALTVSGLGAVTVGIAAAVHRLPERR